MAKPKRTKHQREADLEIANRLHLQGEPNWRIAEYISSIRPYTIGHTQIAYDLGTIRSHWREHTTLRIDEVKQRELARLDVLERQYWEQFEASKGVRRDGSPRPGDPLFLQGIERIVELRSKLLGLEAPKRTEHSGYIEVSQNARTLVMAKVEAIANRGLYPTELGGDHQVPRALPEPGLTTDDDSVTTSESNDESE